MYMNMRVTVIGTGYVGTVTGACLAYLGHRVTCVDTDRQRSKNCGAGEPPIYEPGAGRADLVCAGERGGIDFETELERPVRESDVIFIAVGTPPCLWENRTSRTWKARPAASAPRWIPRVPRGGEQVHGTGGLRQSGGGAGARRHSRCASPACRQAMSLASRVIRSFSAKAPRFTTRFIPDRIVVGADDPTTADDAAQLYGPLDRATVRRAVVCAASQATAFMEPRNSAGRRPPSPARK